MSYSGPELKRAHLLQLPTQGTTYLLHCRAVFCWPETEVKLKFLPPRPISAHCFKDCTSSPELHWHCRCCSTLPPTKATTPIYLKPPPPSHLNAPGLVSHGRAERGDISQIGVSKYFQNPDLSGFLFNSNKGWRKQMVTCSLCDSRKWLQLFLGGRCSFNLLLASWCLS